MKTKLIITKVLIIALCLSILIIALDGCMVKQKDFDSLQTVTAEVKETADKAATAEALANAVAELNAVKITADAAATKEALAAAEEALKALVASGDASNQAAIALLNTAIEELKSGKADASTLNATKTELLQKINDNIALIDGINATILALGNTDAELAEKLETAKTELNKLITANEVAIGKLDNTYATDTALAEAEAALNIVIQANTDAIATNKALIDGINATILALGNTDEELAEKLETTKNDLQNQITAVETSVSGLSDSHAKLEAAAATKAALEEAVEGLETEAATMKAELEEKIAALNAKLTAVEGTANVNKSDIANLRADLTKISGDLATLTAKVNNNETAIGNLQAAVDAISKLEGETDLVKEIKNIQTALAKCATAEGLKSVESALRTLIDTKASKTDLNDVKTSLEGALADIAACATTEAMNAAIEAAKKELTAATDLLNTSLNKRLDDLTAALQALTSKQSDDIAGVQTSITGLQTSLSSLESAVNALQNADFSDKYNYASKVLMGIEGIEAEDVGFSLRDFENYVASISSSDYDETIYNTFKIEAERERFYLNRALSVEDIKASFARLEALVDELPTLLESISMKLDKIDGENPEYPIENTNKFDEYIDSITSTYNKLPDGDKATIDTRYNAILAAYENLLNAVDAADAVISQIGSIPTEMVYGSTEAAVEAARESFDAYSAQYFANADVTALYGENMTAEAFVTNYETLTGYETTVAALQTAFDNKPMKNEKVENFANVKPLFSDLDELSAHKAAIAAWAEENNVNDANKSAMYGDEYLGNVENAVKYATTMMNIYTGNDVAGLLEMLNGLCAEEHFVVYTDKETADACRSQLNLLENAINAYATSEGSINDGNLEAMVSTELRNAFAAVEARVASLMEAKGKFEALLTEMNALTVTPALACWETIASYKTTIDTYCTTYEISADDANYNGFVKAANEKQEALMDEYDALTEDISKVYAEIEQIKDEVAAGKSLLSSGIQLYNIWVMIPEMITEFSIYDSNLIVRAIDGTPVNFNDFVSECTTMFTEYKQLALTAQTEAAVLVEAIRSAQALSEKDIKNVDSINDVLDDVKAWLNKYVEGETDTVTYSDRLAEIANVQIADESGKTYVFLSAADYEAIVTHANNVNTHKAEAEVAWTEIDAKLFALVAEQWNIHSDFATADDAYQAYIATYYASDISASTQCFGEWDAYQEFAPVMAEYTTKRGEAGAKAEEIINAINGLVVSEIDETNAADVLANITIINEMIANYESEYHCNILECTVCGVDADMVLVLKKAEAKATYVVKYVEILTKYAEELTAGTAGVTESILAGDYDIAIGAFNTATLTNIDTQFSFWYGRLEGHESNLEAAQTPTE